MKINEKNLCAYATSSAVVADKEGYLMKKGEVNKGFQKRWFVLKGNLLFYFEKRSDKEPLGVVILEGCTVELDENDAQFSFKIVFHGMGNRSYVLCADSQESMEQWMKSLACASYDYMKLMVTELQRQLKETLDKEKKTSDVEGMKTPIEDCNTEDSSVSLVDDNYEMSHSRNVSHMTSTSSPHPPPRQRHNVHHRMQNSQSNLSQPNLYTSRSKSGNNLGPSGQVTSNSFLTHSGSRNKITFKDVHTGFGRPVLRDRNMWRYNRKTDNTIQTDSTVLETSRGIPEQNLLISL